MDSKDIEDRLDANHTELVFRAERIKELEQILKDSIIDANDYRQRFVNEQAENRRLKKQLSESKSRVEQLTDWLWQSHGGLILNGNPTAEVWIKSIEGILNVPEPEDRKW